MHNYAILELMPTDTNQLPPVLTIVQTAALLGVSRGLAYEAARRGEIPALKIGRRIVVPRDALLARLAAAGETAPTSLGARGG